MDVLALISRNFVAPLWAVWERSPYLRHYGNMLRTQYDPPEMIRLKQDDAARKIAAHAYQTSVFWKGQFDAVGITPKDIQGVNDLSHLPLLTKADLRRHGEDMISDHFRKNDLIKHVTSGSTGVSVTTFRDSVCQQIKRAATLRSDEWSGWRLGERVAAVWGNPQIRTDWKGIVRQKLLDRHYLHLDTLRMNEETMGEFLEGMARTPPSMLYGHAHSLYLLARFCQARYPGFSIRPKAILSTCMVLHDFERERIEETFSQKVTNRYGCEEVSLIASECEQHDGLHVNSDCLYVEVVNSHGDACETGQSGRIVVTDLVNQGMPLLRYEVGDTAAWSNHSCSCGRTLPMLAKIEGRVADYVITRSGEFISGISLTENLAVKVPGIAQMQIVQEAIDRFTFNIVKGPDFGETSVSTLDKLVSEILGSTVKYECAYLANIPQEASGKYRFCISKVEKDFS